MPEEKTEKKTQKEDNLIPWKAGDPSPNPSGRPKGQRNYATIYREALVKIGQTKGMTPEEVEEEMEKVGLDKALGGEYKFFRDIRDRIHGKPVQGLEMSGKDGQPIDMNLVVSFVKNAGAIPGETTVSL